MKTISTLFLCLVVTISTLFKTAKAQCVSPVLTYHNPVLIGGTAGEVNAKYKFSTVSSGVDAIMTVTGKTGGATLTSIDDNTYGYAAAWQPVVHTKITAGAGEGFVSFRIDFVKSYDNSVTHNFPCFALSFIDIDGDNDKVSEFVETKQFDSYQTSLSSLLTITQNNGFTRAQGPVLNYPDLDTTSYPTNIVFKFTNKNMVQEVRVGNRMENNFIPQNRYNLGYFTPMVFPALLPVKYHSFNAAVLNSAVTLNWVTEMEVNNSHFEIQQSFNGTNFSALGNTSNAVALGSSRSYTFVDNNAELKNNSVVYYRLKQFDKDGKYIISEVLMVKLKAMNDINMQVSPNPFVENLTVRFTTQNKGVAQLQVVSATGQKIIVQQIQVTKGYNSVQVMGINRLQPGVYAAKLVVDGNVSYTQKLIKN
jgi:hypothetical protein